MRSFAMIGALVAFGSLQPASAQSEGPWCINIMGDFHESRCDFQTYEACRAAIAATPGIACGANPRYRAPAARPSKQRQERSRP